jgi:hypothetical protein
VVRIIPTKYNIIVHLWTYKLLESLRRAAFASPLVLEYLQGDEFYPSVVCPFKFLELHGYNDEYTILPTLHYPQKPLDTAPLARFPFLSPSGSSLLLRFLMLISVVLNLISMIGYEEPGVIAMLIFISWFC